MPFTMILILYVIPCKLSCDFSKLTILYIHVHNANDYWKLLKGEAKPQKIHSILDTEFYDYFVKYLIQ